MTLAREITLDFRAAGPAWSPERVFVTGDARKTRLEFSYLMAPTEGLRRVGPDAQEDSIGWQHLGNPVEVGQKSIRVMSVEVAVPLSKGGAAVLKEAARAVNYARRELLPFFRKRVPKAEEHYGCLIDSTWPQIEAALSSDQETATDRAEKRPESAN